MRLPAPVGNTPEALTRWALDFIQRLNSFLGPVKSINELKLLPGIIVLIPDGMPVPDLFVIADGRELKTASYPELGKALGYPRTTAAPDGFNVPDIFRFTPEGLTPLIKT